MGIDTEIEFVKVASGSVKTCLNVNLQVYAQNQDEADEFLSEGMTHVDYLYYVSYDE